MGKATHRGAGPEIREVRTGGGSPVVRVSVAVLVASILGMVWVAASAIPRGASRAGGAPAALAPGPARAEAGRGSARGEPAATTARPPRSSASAPAVADPAAGGSAGPALAAGTGLAGAAAPAPGDDERDDAGAPPAKRK